MSILSAGFLNDRHGLDKYEHSRYTGLEEFLVGSTTFNEYITILNTLCVQ